jgi:hypothetical protein
MDRSQGRYLDTDNKKVEKNKLRCFQRVKRSQFQHNTKNMPGWQNEMKGGKTVSEELIGNSKYWIRKCQADKSKNDIVVNVQSSKLWYKYSVLMNLFININN